MQKIPENFPDNLQIISVIVYYAMKYFIRYKFFDKKEIL